MKRAIWVMAALLVLLVALPMMAQRPAGTTNYRVSLLLYPGDDPGALAAQVATIYRGKLEGAVDAAGTFTIALSESMASMIVRDPHVRSVEKLAPGAAVTSDATATSAIGTNAVTEWKLGDYQYDGSGNIKKIGADFFVYDSRSRLTRGDAGTGHKQEYTYDGFGNVRTIITDAPASIPPSQTSPYKTSVAVNPKTNRAEYPGTDTGNPNETDPLTGQAYSMAAEYDATGNVIALQINDNDTFQYDGLGRVTKAKIDGAWRAYVYTASDERIGTIALSSENGPETGSSWTIRDIEGKVLRRYAKSGSTWTWNEDYIYRGSQMLAAEVPGETKHFHLDHLGTPRLVTDSEGVEISRHTYYPFGYEVGAATSGEKQFTGHERDSATLDYMHARYYGPSWGRFLSVDPGKDWNMHQPQSWNMYTYVRNNPINRIDPNGRCGEGPDFVGPKQLCAEPKPKKEPTPESEKKGTLSVGVTVSGAAVALSGSVNAAVSVDRQGEVAGSVTGGVGPTTAGAGVTAGVTGMVTNATSVTSLSGKGVTGGASAGAVAAVSVDHVAGPQGKGKYEGVAITIGPGVKTPEAHYQATYTWMVTGSQLLNSFTNWYARTELAAQNWVYYSLPNLEE